jgi:hypothetical protein
MAVHGRSWDVKYESHDDLDGDVEFQPAGFDEAGLEAHMKYKYDAAGQLRAVSLADGEAGFEEYLVNRWLKGSMTARDVCTIAYWATAAGASGFAKTLAFRPDAPSGHFSRHLRLVLNMDTLASNQMTLEVPCYNRADFERSVMKLPCIPVFEALASEIAQTPNMAARLATMVGNAELPPVVTEHCVFKASGGLAVPVVLYVDAVPIAKKESLLGFWVHTLVTGLRHLVCVVRKSRFCQCGCHGWCTIWPIMQWLQWNFLALAAGEYPGRMPNGQEWKETGRTERGYTPLGFTACLVAIKGDWAEFAHTFGVPNWQSNIAPCPHCMCDKESMHKDDDLSPLSSPWEDFTSDEYDRAASACEIHVVLDIEAHRALRSNLVYDSSKAGFRGRVLSTDLPQYHLNAGDRLEPSSSIPDTGCGFDNTSSFPVTATFWRTANETRTKHRNPLYSPSIGISVVLMLVDMLHAFYLGLLQNFASDLTWELIICNCWDITSNRSWDDHVTLSVRLLAIELHSFYNKWHEDNRGQRLTVVQQFLAPMIGTRDHRSLKLKAGETKGYFMFLCTVLERRGYKLNRLDVWKQGAAALIGIIHVTRTSSFVLTPRIYQVFILTGACDG